MNGFKIVVTAGVFVTLSLLGTLSGCAKGGGQPIPPPVISSGDSASSHLPDTSSLDPVTPPTASNPDLAPASPQAAPLPTAPSYEKAILLFTGMGVSTSDWQSTEQIIQSDGLTYQLVNTAQLNAMSVDEISRFGMILVPGGSGGTIADNLSDATQLNLRKAVQERGVSYLGFCAGAWIAVGPEAPTTAIADYGLALAPGAVLPAFYPGGNTSLEAAMVDTAFADGSHRQLVWWGGPSTPEWKGGVIARYAETGEPAISETWSGKGYVIVSGPHPEAPQSWRGTAGYDSDGLDFDLTIQLIHGALEKKPLVAF